MWLTVATTVSGDCAEATTAKSKIKQLDQIIDRIPCEEWKIIS
jgi:hypothetical protein